MNKKRSKQFQFVIENKLLNKKELLETLGYAKEDNTANDTINKYNGKFWECKQEKKGKPYNITLK